MAINYVVNVEFEPYEFIGQKTFAVGLKSFGEDLDELIFNATVQFQDEHGVRDHSLTFLVDIDSLHFFRYAISVLETEIDKQYWRLDESDGATSALVESPARTEEPRGDSSEGVGLGPSDTLTPVLPEVSWIGSLPEKACVKCGRIGFFEHCPDCDMPDPEAG